MYISRTEHIKGNAGDESKLLISFIKPHKNASKDTISRWIKSVLHMSGVDTEIFTAGRVRPAAASKAKAMAVPVAHIMAKAGWARVTTFAKYYDKIINRDTDQFQEAVLA